MESVSDDDVVRETNTMLDQVAEYMYPALRLAAALGVVWFASSGMR